MKERLLYCSLCLIMLCACDSGPKYQVVEPFYHVYVQGGSVMPNIILSQEDSYGYSITGNSRDALVFVRNDTLFGLFYNIKKGSNTLFLCSKDYKTIEASLCNKIATTDTIWLDSLQLNILNYGKTKIQLYANYLNAYLSGTSTVILSGYCTETHWHLTALKDLNALNLWTDYTYVQADASNDLSINVNKQLWIEKAFMSTIKYFGDPDIMQTNMRSSDLIYKIFAFPKPISSCKTRFENTVED